VGDNHILNYGLELFLALIIYFEHIILH